MDNKNMIGFLRSCWPKELIWLGRWNM